VSKKCLIVSHYFPLCWHLSSMHQSPADFEPRVHTRAPPFSPLFFPYSYFLLLLVPATVRERPRETEERRERERERENRPRGWDSPGEKKRKRPVVITYEFVPGRFLIFDSWLIYVGFCENLWVEICCRRWMGVLDFLFNRIGIAGFLGILF
jgi:hypothetical protein